MEASTKGGLISSFTKPQNDLFGESLIYRTLYQNSSLSRLNETRATQCCTKTNCRGLKLFLNALLVLALFGLVGLFARIGFFYRWGGNRACAYALWWKYFAYVYVYMSINYSMPKESSLFKEVNFNDDIYNSWGQCLTETGGRVAPGGQPWKKILGVT